ncbi:MAG: hypothetical protein GY842_12165 [bacterium]|nr:hypothetical protein [bacterium]
MANAPETKRPQEPVVEICGGLRPSKAVPEDAGVRRHSPAGGHADRCKVEGLTTIC